jgi:hypothetical protein
MGCECVLMSGDGITVSGIGTAGDPFIITNSRQQLGVTDTPSLDLTVAGSLISGKVQLAPVLKVADTPTVDLTLAGGGTEAVPFTLSAAIKGVVLEGGATGSVLTQKPDGSWGPGPATQAPLGAVSTANGVKGDGSGGNPVRISARTYAEWEAIVDNATF